ncbi:uncharacterized protein LOC116256616 [Nymphaea colorata]|uniref:uncharacterized protein LOC116256616 n=1 Tax=Nymphaea colorata TaxID=210225 RepID=UPI00214E1E21|nr:uncharacterized protein LOC116256616 [Nymphaea colorata]
MVAGASSGLGCEFCLDPVKAGCNVVAAARRTTLLQSLSDEINAMRDRQARCGSAVALQLDVSVEVVKKAWAVFGRINVLINNAVISYLSKKNVQIWLTAIMRDQANKEVFNQIM